MSLEERPFGDVRRFAFESWGVQAAVEWETEEFDDVMPKLLLPTWRQDDRLQPDAVFRLKRTADGGVAVETPQLANNFSVRTDVLENVERRLHLYLASETRQAAYVHAGVIAWKGKAVVFPASSWSGKSTLVLALVKAGAQFVSDEYAIVGLDGHVYPFPRPMALRLPDLPSRISAEELGWTSSRQAYPLGAVICTKFTADEEWAPKSLTSGEAVLELLAHTVSAQKSPDIVLKCLTRAVEGAKCWKGARGESEDSARRILETLG